MTLMEEYDRRRERAAQDAENSARLAQSYAVFITEGTGTSHYEERVPFGLTFIEKPVVSYASMCDVEEIAGFFDVEVEDIDLPHCTGYVVEWDQDERDFYVGCWVAAKVAFTGALPGEGADNIVTVEHHFTFSAVGMKDIPPDMQDAVE